MLSRYYEAPLGKFLSPDSFNFHDIGEKVAYLEEPQNWNKYSYALNNPLKLKDASGRTISYTPAYRQEMKTNPTFKANHLKALSNPEGARIHDKLGKSPTLLPTWANMR